MSTASLTDHVLPPDLDEPPLLSERPAEPLVRYVLPLLWSLHYALTKTQWAMLRDRHKERFPDWEQCSCPKRCKANALDEHWKYDEANHIKIFTGAAFICKGCHWLKSPGFRVSTWLRQVDGSLVASLDPPHIISCLGWTQQKVDALRAMDLSRHQMQRGHLAQLDQQVKQGQAAIVPSPVERLTQQELARHVMPGQLMIVPWRVDLSALGAYGYDSEEIATFEQRMYRVAAQRMAGKTGVGKETKEV